MQENFFHILSKVPCEININGANLGLIDNVSNFELDFITRTDKIYVNFTPISYSKNSLPYTVQLNTANVITCENQNVQIIPFPNNHYDVIFEPFEYLNTSANQTILLKNFSKYSVAIVNSISTQINIFSNNNIVKSIEIPYVTTAKASEKKDLIIIECVIDKDNYYLVIINSGNLEVLYNNAVQSIEVTDNEISSYRNLDDISNHAEIFKIQIDNKNIEKYYVYKDNTCHNPKSMVLIPEDFLECLKVDDENKCRMLLASNLSSTPLEKFRNYFGDVKNIYFNRHANFYDKLNYTIQTNSYKNYNFIMQNNQIKDIEEVF